MSHALLQFHFSFNEQFDVTVLQLGRYHTKRRTEIRLLRVLFLFFPPANNCTHCNINIIFYTKTNKKLQHKCIVNENRLRRNTYFHMRRLRGGVALTLFRSLKTFRLTFLRMRDKCKIINVQRNNKAFSV